MLHYDWTNNGGQVTPEYNETKPFRGFPASGRSLYLYIGCL